MKKILCVFMLLLLCSCGKADIGSTSVGNTASAGNIQNGGYVIGYSDGFLYADETYHHLYFKNADGDNEKISAGHYFYEMNLYNDELYYTSSYPGAVWKMSVSSRKKEKVLDRNVGNLILYDDHMYYRLSEDNDWGKLYRADMNGHNRQLLADKVICFCIYDDCIYYMDIYNDRNMLCAMKSDGTEKTDIISVYTDHLSVENGVLIYSDHDRNDELYTYDLNTNAERCISKDKCWNINCNEKWILYRNQSDGGSLYRIDYDGGNKRKLADGNITDILIIDNDVFYRDVNNNNNIGHLTETPA